MLIKITIDITSFPPEQLQLRDMKTTKNKWGLEKLVIFTDNAGGSLNLSNSFVNFLAVAMKNKYTVYLCYHLVQKDANNNIHTQTMKKSSIVYKV